MLETSEERIKFLKKGFTQKQIEKMYIENNDFKIISLPKLVDIVEIEAGKNKNTCETANLRYLNPLCQNKQSLHLLNSCSHYLQN